MNRIITEKVKTLKAMGKQALHGHWAEAILFTLLCEIIVTGPSVAYSALSEHAQSSIFGNTLAMVLNVYGIFVHGPISLSLANFFIKLFRQEKLDKAGVEIKYGFGQVKKALSIYIRVLLLTWLGSLFFLIPGIIAALNYSQAFYILADDPTKSPSQCMFESKFIMRGNKMKYISLIISFVGWYLLAAIPAGICHIVLDSSTIQMMRDFILQGDMYNALIYASIAHPIVNVLLFLQVIITPYVNASKVSFFDILCGKLVVKQYDDISVNDIRPNEEPATQVIDVEVVSEEPYEYKEIKLNSEENNDELH